MNSHLRSVRALPIAALMLVQMIFGLNFAASKVILAVYPPLLWGGIRLLVAAILMFLFSLFLVKREQRRMDFEFLSQAFIYGFMGITASQAFLLGGLKLTSTTNAAILCTLTPIFTLLFGIMAGAEKFTTRRVVGFVLALMGAVVIRNFEEFRITSDTFKGDLFIILNCAALAMFFVFSRNFLKKNSPYWATAWMFLFGAIVLLGISVSDFSKAIPEVIDQPLVIAVLYNIVLATVVTYFLNSWTLTKVSPSQVAIFIYLQPAIAVLYAWISGGELPSLRVYVAMALIFSGVLIGVVRGAVKKT